MTETSSTPRRARVRELRRRRVARRAPPARPTRSATRGGRPSRSASSRPRAPRTCAPPSTAARRRVPGVVRAARRRSAAAFFVKAADALERRVEQIAQDMTREMGKPLREARMEAARDGGDPPLLRRRGAGGRSGERLRAVRRPAASSTPIRRPLGVVGLITPWNFPAAIPVWKLAPALDLRQHRRAQARATRRRSPGLHLAACFDEAGLPAGRPQRRHRARARRSAAGSSRNPRRARDLVHRLGRGRPQRARRGDGARQARPARARRPQPADRDGRRRSRPRRRGGLRRRVLVGRPEVHGDAAHLRPGRRLRRRSATRLLARIDARQGRRPGRSRRPRSARSSTRRSSTRSSAAIERGRGRGRHGRSPAASAPTTRPT